MKSTYIYRGGNTPHKYKQMAKKIMDCKCSECGALFKFEYGLYRKNLNKSQNYCKLVVAKADGEFEECSGELEVLEQ